MPEITLSLPAALGILVLIIIVGAGVVYLLTRKTNTPVAVAFTPTFTATTSPTVTLTPTELPSATIAATFTALPKLSYTVKSNDVCSSIAAIFKVSINSIILLNNLDANCTLSVGQVLVIPQPTATASPQPTGTLNAAQSTDAACQKVTYTVKANDTLSGIAASYNVTIASIRDQNGLVADTVQEGQILSIPLCHQQPTAGPTPTATPPPPYAAPNLLLPADGVPFNATIDTITLQWAMTGTLLSNEAYEVIIEDVTDTNGKKLVDYVTDTKYIIPTSFRPTDNIPHIMRWSVLTVRQTGTDSAGKPVYTSAGATSTPRVFTWTGGASVLPTVTPTP
jgi:LysM repeat protein